MIKHDTYKHTYQWKGINNDHSLQNTWNHIYDTDDNLVELSSVTNLTAQEHIQNTNLASV